MGGDECLKQLAFITLQKTEEGLGVFSNVMMNVEERRGRGLEFGECSRSDLNRISDSADFEQDRAVGQAFDDAATQGPDHRASRLPIAVATLLENGEIAR